VDDENDDVPHGEQHYQQAIVDQGHDHEKTVQTSPDNYQYHQLHASTKIYGYGRRPFKLSKREKRECIQKLANKVPFYIQG
jgi:hypothetical protein